MHKIKYSLIFLLLIASANYASAQLFSPYSQYGLGTTQKTSSAIQMAMGHTGAAYNSAFEVNYTNPAALADLGLSTFDIGVRLNTNTINQGNSSVPLTVAGGGVNNVSLSFPVMKQRWGMSFGLLPYSFSKYKFVDTQSLNGETLNISNEGDGSLYKLYLSNGVKWKGFKVGITASLLFGKLSNTLTTSFSSNSSSNSSRLNKSMSVRDVMLTVGAQYHHILTPFEKRDKDKTNLEMTVGAYFSPSLKMDAFVDDYLEATRVNNKGKVIPTDTAVGALFGKYATTQIPMQVGTGIMLHKNNRWNVSLDYEYKSWKNFSSPIRVSALTDEWHIRFGAGITPKIKSKNYFNRITYRFGGHYGKSPVIRENKGVSDFGITFGFGLPFARYKYSARSLSNLNIAFEIGSLGAFTKQNLTETYYNFTLSYTLSDVWFRKQKFD